ncbi:MAG: hypothetical protein ABFR35_05305 [Thermodesulfobacteriota bacterium]
MKRFFAITAKAATVLTLLFALVLVGCSPQTGTTTRQYDENWRFVPRIHVDNSFGEDYRGCSYDQFYEGYWCPADW